MEIQSYHAEYPLVEEIDLIKLKKRLMEAFERDVRIHGVHMESVVDGCEVTIKIKLK